VKSDPFAPATSDRHAKNITAAALLSEEGEPLRNRFAELLELHLTPHEEAANLSPSVEEAERRQTLVDEFREQLAAEGPDADLPTLEDETGALYQWHEGDRPDGGDGDPDGQPDGTTSSGWRFIGEPEEGDPAGSLQVPPRNGPGSSTEAWREFAAGATLTEPTQWSTLSRDEIIHTLENDGVIQRENA
jgi:hypothetical protein